MENYTWFYKSKYIDRSHVTDSNDKIGISSDGRFMIHDGIINKINLYKRVKSNGSMRLIYNVENQPNLMFHSYSTFVYFKFDVKNGEPIFSYLGFNGGEYRERLNN